MADKNSMHKMVFSNECNELAVKEIHLWTTIDLFGGNSRFVFEMTKEQTKAIMWVARCPYVKHVHELHGR